MKRTIIIDPGHGGKDPGAVAPNGMPEKQFTLAGALLLSTNLIWRGYYTVLTRKGDTYVSLKERVKIAEENRGDLFISLHCNSYDDEEANGFEVCIYSRESPAYFLAHQIKSRLMLNTPLKPRGIIERPDLYILRKTSMPAVLVELGFLSNYRDLEILSYPEAFSRIIAQIADSIIYFGATRWSTT